MSAEPEYFIFADLQGSGFQWPDGADYERRLRVELAKNSHLRAGPIDQ